MLGLCDGNNFYVSCERVFDPRLYGKSVLVLSNNDGCCIARSNEAKQLGVRMGQPIHEVPTHVRRQSIVRSANFALYGDLSGRVVAILRDLFPLVEVYSIDEAFVGFQGIRATDHERVACEARARILQWTGIPCSFGLGPTKTLAKLANKLAKTAAGGVRQAAPGDAGLDCFPVGDVWGVGSRWAQRLGADGILTAGDLAAADAETLRARYGVVLARTQRELQGMACQALAASEPDRQQIVVSRSFGQDIDAREPVIEAVATFAVRAAEKMRARALHAGAVWVWLHTNPFKPGTPQYHPSRALSLETPSGDTRQILRAATELVSALWRPGYHYKKAGVGLLNLAPTDAQQGDLFADLDPRSAALMHVMDQANRRFGRGALGLGVTGWRARPPWRMRQQALSPAYTTRWDQLLKVR